jgi:hypothetical protein
MINMKKIIGIPLILLLAGSVFAAWSDWAAIPEGIAVGEPSVVITNDGTIHVMVRGTDNALWWTRSKDGGKTWFGNKTNQKWTKVGGVLTSSPSCMEPIPNVVECYVRNIEKGVSQIDRINDAWGPWAGVGGIIMTNISATAYNKDVRRLFVVNNKGGIASNLWDGRNFSPAQWLGWTNWDDQVGKTSWISCSDLGANSSVDFGGDVDIQAVDTACVVNLPGGPLSLIAKIGNGSQQVLPNFAKAASDFPVSIRLHSVSTALDVYYVGKDKQMKRGMYKFGSGWVGEIENIGNGQFTSGPSCNTGKAPTNVNAICTGRGTDGAVWFSLRRPGDDIGPDIDPGTVGTGKVIFNAGNAGTDVNAMYKRPSAAAGTTLTLKPSDGVECAGGSCFFNLGVLLVRKNSNGISTVQAFMTGSTKLQNGMPVNYAGKPSTFPKGTKTIAASVRVQLTLGQTTPVTVKITPKGGKFADAKFYETFVVNVAVSK